VEEAPEGGFVARALGESIIAEPNGLDKSYERVRDAARCHFDEGKVPHITFPETSLMQRLFGK